MNNKVLTIAALMTYVLSSLPAGGSTPLTDSVCWKSAARWGTTPKIAMGFKELLECLSEDSRKDALPVPVGLSEPGCLLLDSRRLVRGTMVGSVLKEHTRGEISAKYGMGGEDEKEEVSHASHVAAIIAGKTKSGAFAHIGAGGRVKILTANSGSDDVGLDHFANMTGSFAVNLSCGLPDPATESDEQNEFSEEIAASIRQMAKSGKAIFMALGNDSLSSDNKYVKGFAALAHEINSSEEYSGAFVLVGNAHLLRNSKFLFADSSNYVNAADKGEKYVLAAWGYQVRSLVGKDEFEEYTGTSMSTPYVTAAYALLQQYFPKMPARAIVSAILEGAVRLKSNDVVGGDVSKFGRGFLNVAGAYKILKKIEFPRLPDHISLAKNLSDQMVIDLEKKVLRLKGAGPQKRLFKQLKKIYKGQDEVTSDVIISAMVEVMGSIKDWGGYDVNSLSLAKVTKSIQTSINPRAKAYEHQKSLSDKLKQGS